MESMSIDPAVGLVATNMVATATQGMEAGAAATPMLTELLPAGADVVSVQAATAFAAEGAAVLAAATAAQEELARVGAALMDIARMYTEVDAGTSAPVSTAVGPGGAMMPRLRGAPPLPPSAGAPAVNTLAGEALSTVTRSAPAGAAAVAAAAVEGAADAAATDILTPGIAEAALAQAMSQGMQSVQQFVGMVGQMGRHSGSPVTDVARDLDGGDAVDKGGEVAREESSAGAEGGTVGGGRAPVDTVGSPETDSPGLGAFDQQFSRGRNDTS